MHVTQVCSSSTPMSWTSLFDCQENMPALIKGIGQFGTGSQLELVLIFPRLAVDS